METSRIIDISRDQLFAMSELVETSVYNSLQTLFESNPLRGQNVIDNDKTINSYEIDIDNTTYNILASDRSSETMTLVLSIQKINTILERIGDHAVNIAESAISLVRENEKIDLLDLPRMADSCREILHASLMGFFENRLDIAEDVLTRDDVVDAININISNSCKEKVKTGTMLFETAIEIIRISKNIERIADLSTNIAEETCFYISGRNIKHSVE
jgi:phosphate transport system protein